MNAQMTTSNAPPAIPEGKTFKVNVAPHLEDKGPTPSSRITWLHYHARITRPTASEWYNGNPSRVDLATLHRICEVLDLEVDQVLVETDDQIQVNPA